MKLVGNNRSAGNLRNFLRNKVRLAGEANEGGVPKVQPTRVPNPPFQSRGATRGNAMGMARVQINTKIIILHPAHVAVLPLAISSARFYAVETTCTSCKAC